MSRCLCVCVCDLCVAADDKIPDVTASGDDVTGIDGDAANDYSR